ncbi:dihydroneopterin aldolase [Halarcobacter sp.]|uniref:dihydroneopterin aldolase n=1 Tax=Halarcobacter sp. TaxID=2321133 RepID=UPI002AA73281|nr:dihydroneopterin aldolase [Halarcobacter sp.]
MKISINNLSFYCIIGILDFERKKEQKVLINLSFKYKFKDSSTFIDYAEVAKNIEDIMKKEKFALIEDAILYLKTFLKNKYKLKKLKINISKPNILTNCIVSISNK